jgi:hypothetical protein
MKRSVNIWRPYPKNLKRTQMNPIWMSSTRIHLIDTVTSKSLRLGPSNLVRLLQSIAIFKFFLWFSDLDYRNQTSKI